MRARPAPRSSGSSVKKSVSARGELRCRDGGPGRADREEVEEERKKPNQPGTEEAEVVAGGGEDDVDGVAGGTSEEIAAELAVFLHVTDDGLDASAPPDLATNGRRDAALLP